MKIIKLRTISSNFLDIIHPTFNGRHSPYEQVVSSLDAKIGETELRERYKAYLGSHYLGLHITVVSVVLAVAGVAAASLITRPMGADHQLLVLWLLWVGSLAATAVAYGGTMVGAFALPASIPFISDLLLPLFLGITEFLLFTILITQVTAAGLSSLVNTWLVLMAVFAAFAELSILRARHHYAAGVRDCVYSDDIVAIIKQYLQCLLRDSIGAGIVMVLAATGAVLRISGTIEWPTLVFPLAITAVLMLGLKDHSDTAKMWREFLPSYRAVNTSKYQEHVKHVNVDDVARHARSWPPEMSGIGLRASGMNEPPGRYDVTVTVTREGSYLPDPAEFAVAAKQAASRRNASVMTAHTAEQIISIVSVQTADQPAAVAVALAVMSEVLRRPAASPGR